MNSYHDISQDILLLFILCSILDKISWLLFGCYDHVHSPTQKNYDCYLWWLSTSIIIIITLILRSLEGGFGIGWQSGSIGIISSWFWVEAEIAMPWTMLYTIYTRMYKSFGVFHVGVEDAETSSFSGDNLWNPSVCGSWSVARWIELICLMQFGFESRISHI